MHAPTAVATPSVLGGMHRGWSLHAHPATHCPTQHTHTHTRTHTLTGAGFSLAGGAVWASATFLLAFLLYRGTVVPAEERMLREAYGDQYEQYA